MRGEERRGEERRGEERRIISVIGIISHRIIHHTLSRTSFSIQP